MSKDRQARLEHAYNYGFQPGNQLQPRGHTPQISLKAILKKQLGEMAYATDADGKRTRRRRAEGLVEGMIIQATRGNGQALKLIWDAIEQDALPSSQGTLDQLVEILRLSRE